MTYVGEGDTPETRETIRRAVRAMMHLLGLPPETEIDINDLHIRSEPDRVRIRMSAVDIEIPRKED